MTVTAERRRAAAREGVRRGYLVWKRVLDVLLSGTLLVLLALPMYLVAVAVRADSVGPAIFRQTRLGRDLVPFTVLKFRTMRVDAPHDLPSAALFGEERDRALTRVGRFLRRTSLDELPQLWNVFVGDMAFVGPRPERKFYIEMNLTENQFSRPRVAEGECVLSSYAAPTATLRPYEVNIYKVK